MSPRAMTRYVFEVVKYRAVKAVDCAGCGKKVRRSRTFDATINPWNVRVDGTQRTRSEILIGLREQAAAWMAEPDYCTACLRLDLRPRETA